MIKNFNEWYIDVNLAPQEGLIEKRLECIADYAESVDANDICNLVNLYYGLTTDKEDLESFASVFIEKDPTSLVDIQKSCLYSLEQHYWKFPPKI